MTNKISILIAESVIDLAQSLAGYLTYQGFDVSIVNNGATAKRMLLSQQFDYLITDILLPEIDGLQLLTWLAQQELSINIVVSSSINFERLPLPNEGNIIMRLPKPYNQEWLLALATKLKTPLHKK